MSHRLNSGQEAVRAALEDGYHYPGEIAEQVSRTPRTVYRILQALVSMKLVEDRGFGGRHHFYVLVTGKTEMSFRPLQPIAKQILGELEFGPKCIHVLSTFTSLSRQAISRHLKELVTTGWAEYQRKEGGCKLYVPSEQFYRFREHLGELPIPVEQVVLNAIAVVYGGLSPDQLVGFSADLVVFILDRMYRDGLVEPLDQNEKISYFLTQKGKQRVTELKKSRFP